MHNAVLLVWGLAQACHSSEDLDSWNNVMVAIYYSTKTERKLYFGPYCTYLCQSIEMATHTSCPRQVVMADHHTLYRGEGLRNNTFQ